MASRILWLALLGLCSASNKSSIQLRFEKNWRVFHPVPKSVQNIQVFFINGTIHRILESESTLFLTNYSFDIGSIDPEEKNTSCRISLPPTDVETSKNTWQIVKLGNGKLVARSSASENISIINVATCTKITAEIPSDDIIPHHDKFDLINYKSPCASDCGWVDRYDDELRYLQFRSISRDENYRPIFLGWFEDSDECEPRYFSIRRWEKSCDIFHFFSDCYESEIDILNRSFNIVRTRDVSIYVDAYSAVHGNFSVCAWASRTFTCKLFDSNLNSRRIVQWTFGKTITIRYLKVHNLPGGGAIVGMYLCSSEKPTLCDIHYFLIGPAGEISVKPSQVQNYVAAGTNHPDPNSCYELSIFEKDVKGRIYCMVLPCSSLTEVKCIGL
ncbi:hypothetical protein QAD02_006074 [Eretmocerus hayati]|uniref:Uncharacterized protein n=1 Tax=Eretmocerus hayati TaxID=131215 RepID=A0ACC2N048_9HYME|nr:hypothetical protein QAD02_006074 [Eretmocerus hayati]